MPVLHNRDRAVILATSADATKSIMPRGVIIAVVISASTLLIAFTARYLLLPYWAREAKTTTQGTKPGLFKRFKFTVRSLPLSTAIPMRVRRANSANNSSQTAEGIPASGVAVPPAGVPLPAPHAGSDVSVPPPVFMPGVGDRPLIPGAPEEPKHREEAVRK